MTYFRPINQKEHDRVLAGTSEGPDYCRECGQSYLEHKEERCPEDETECKACGRLFCICTED